VRRGLAVLIVLSLCALQIQSLSFHVHAVPDHADDRDHRHGPAVHHHDDFESALHVDERDASPGSVITMAVPSAIAASAAVAYAELTEIICGPDLRLIGDARTIEVRSHGPPQSRTISLRGPPTSIQS
jgi:hypothetical protein